MSCTAFRCGAVTPPTRTSKSNSCPVPNCAGTSNTFVSSCNSITIVVTYIFYSNYCCCCFTCITCTSVWDILVVKFHLHHLFVHLQFVLLTVELSTLPNRYQFHQYLQQLGQNHGLFPFVAESYHRFLRITNRL